mmetsp:Transcript_33314/g.47301  ORF Transcript_33314/g.47301 Transcript_33314/m.47301 type:complete len:206 (+) Transcript_33314:187-804(+)
MKQTQPKGQIKIQLRKQAPIITIMSCHVWILLIAQYHYLVVMGTYHYHGELRRCSLLGAVVALLSSPRNAPHPWWVLVPFLQTAVRLESDPYGYNKLNSEGEPPVLLRYHPKEIHQWSRIQEPPHHCGCNHHSLMQHCPIYDMGHLGMNLLIVVFLWNHLLVLDSVEMVPKEAPLCYIINGDQLHHVIGVVSVLRTAFSILHVIT